ncbi:TPA: ImmA/IrrE family metallo-endopeptidase [Pseudomonas aeruginosa]
MPKSPKNEANSIHQALRLLGEAVINLDIRDLAVQWSRNISSNAPIIGIKSVPIPSFEGMLAKSPRGDGWMIGVNDQIQSAGRIRFTIAHEFGHFILHRAKQERFECSNQDMHSWDAQGRDIEFEADTFASYLLMPLDDFRKQVDGQAFSFDLMRHCADRYGVSLTAAALKWREIAPGRVIVMAARDGFLIWSCSNTRAFRSGAYFTTRRDIIEVPTGSILLDASRSEMGVSRRVTANLWLPRELPSTDILEHAFVIDGEDFSYTLGVLLLPDYEKPQWGDDEEEFEPLTGRPSF